MEARKITGKKGDMSIDKIIVIVLIILVIVLVIFLIFKADMTKWFKNLPYSYDEQNKDTEVGGKDVEVPSDVCPEGIIGRILLADVDRAWEIDFKQYYIFIPNEKGKNTDLYLKGGSIYYAVGNDKEVAVVMNGKIKRLGSENIPYLSEIEDATIIPGNIICKQEAGK